MPTVRFALALLILLGSWSALHGEPDEIPIVGRPSDLPFSEASGHFEVSTHAEPTTVEAEMPFTFVVTVHAIGNPRHPPVRLDLHELPALAEQFYIEDPPDDTRKPDTRTWEFIYRLKPRRIEVSEVPSLPFVFFNPDIKPASKAFQVIYTDPIPLRVLAHESVQVPVQAPESAFALATGPAMLARQAPWTPPGVIACAFLLLMPPLLCAVWYLCWQRLYPDAARQVRQRRSRAAHQALQMLHAARRLDAEPCATRAAAIVAGYLQQRLDLGIAEPTPREVAALFEQRRCSPALTERAVRFFQTCDGTRFLPAVEGERPDLPDSAIQLILAVEAETCSTEPS